MKIPYSESYKDALSREPNLNMFLEALSLFRNNRKVGIEKLKKVAEIGSPLGMYYVGEAYLAGEGVAQDFGQGMEWLKRAADSGLQEAAYQISRTHWSMGEINKTITILSDLSNCSHALSMLNLAEIYYRIDGFIDKKKSEKYFKMAISSGSVTAKKNYSILLMKGVFGNNKKIIGFLMWISCVPYFIFLGIFNPNSDHLRIR